MLKILPSDQCSDVALSAGDGCHQVVNSSIDDYYNATSVTLGAGYYYDGDSSGRCTRSGDLQFDISGLTRR